MEVLNNKSENLNPIPPVSPEIQTPPVPDQNPKSKFSLILIIGIILFILVAGGAEVMYIFKPKTEKPVAKPVSSLPTKSQTKVDASISDLTQNVSTATASWKTYASTAGGYSVKYPSDWTERHMSGGTVPREELDLISPSAVGMYYQVIVEKNTGQYKDVPIKDAKEYLEITTKDARSGSGVSGGTIDPISLDGTTGYKMVLKTGSINGLAIVVFRNNLIYSISGTESSIFEQFLSSFKFISTPSLLVEQPSQINNNKRKSDVNAILNAVGQYAADHKGNLSALGIPNTTNTPPGVPTNIGSGAEDVRLCTAIVPTYIAQMPVDPHIGSWTNCSNFNSGYIIVMAGNSRITVSAPATEPAGSTVISVTR